MTRFLFWTISLAALLTVAATSSAPTFCKCTCFKNSTIIPLGPASQFQDSSSSPSSIFFRSLSSILSDARQFGDRCPLQASGHSHDRRSASTSCSECTKAFCLSQGIEFCKDAKDENVFTLCFQRDSNKDNFIVWGFILGTVGLLGWAAFKRVIEWRQDQALHRQNIDYTLAGSR